MKKVIIFTLILVLIFTSSCYLTDKILSDVSFGRILFGDKVITGVIIDIVSTGIKSIAADDKGRFPLPVRKGSEEELYLIPSKPGYRFEPSSIAFKGGTPPEFKAHPVDEEYYVSVEFSENKRGLSITGLKKGFAITIFDIKGSVLAHETAKCDGPLLVDCLNDRNREFPEVFYYIAGDEQEATIGRFAF